MLQDFSYENDVQVLVATHAPDFICECPVDSVLWIDREQSAASSIDQVQQMLVDLGAITAADALSPGDIQKIMFVEGEADRRFLRRVVAKLNPDFDTDGLTIAKLPSGKSSANAMSAVNELLKSFNRSDIPIVCVVDNDWQLLGDENTDTDRIVTLPRKEIENFLIEPELLADAFKSISRDGAILTRDDMSRIVDEACEEQREYVRCRLIGPYRDSLDSHVASATQEERATTWFNKSWDDPSWRLASVPGKKVLRSVRRRVQQEYKVTLTAGALLDCMQAPPCDLAACVEVICDAMC
jgi:hypothetical protein